MTNWKDSFPKENRYFETENGILYKGDCLEILKEFPEKIIDLVLTDPPYGINYKSPRPKKGREKDFIRNDELSSFLILFSKFRVILDFILGENSEAYIFSSGGGEIPVLAYAWLELNKGERFKVKNLLVWDKTYPGLGWDWRFQWESIFQLQVGKGLKDKKKASNRSNVLRSKNVIPNKNQHPTQKPEELIFQILKVKNSFLVLDSFSGSGTTLVAAEKLNRKWIGIELEEKYCEITKQRLIKETEHPKLF